MKEVTAKWRQHLQLSGPPGSSQAAHLHPSPSCLAGWDGREVGHRKEVPGASLQAEPRQGWHHEDSQGLEGFAVGVLSYRGLGLFLAAAQNLALYPSYPLPWFLCAWSDSPLLRTGTLGNYRALLWPPKDFSLPQPTGAQRGGGDHKNTLLPQMTGVSSSGSDEPGDSQLHLHTSGVRSSLTAWAALLAGTAWV